MTIFHAKLGLFLVLLFSVLQLANAQDNKHQVAVRLLAPNLLYPLPDQPTNEKAIDNFGIGLEFEYQRRLTPNILVGLPMYFSSTQGVKSLDFNLDGTYSAELERLTMFGTNVLLIFEPIAGRSFFDPQIFTGIGFFSNFKDSTTPELPLGVNLNLNLGNNVYLSPSVSYRIALKNDFDTRIRDNLRIGIGIHFQPFIN